MRVLWLQYNNGVLGTVSSALMRGWGLGVGVWGWGWGCEGGWGLSCWRSMGLWARFQVH